MRWLPPHESNGQVPHHEGRRGAAHRLLPMPNDTARFSGDDMITTLRNRIECLVLQIQADFLDHPRLALTLPAAERRFGVDEVTCASVLGALVGARVWPTAKAPM